MYSRLYVEGREIEKDNMESVRESERVCVYNRLYVEWERDRKR